VAFWLLPVSWGRGLATEAGRAVLDYGVERLALGRIIGLVDPANAGSIRVLEKLGMTRSGVIEYQGEETLEYVIGAETAPRS